MFMMASVVEASVVEASVLHRKAYTLGR
jgi:hypothetical protein